MTRAVTADEGDSAGIEAHPPRKPAAMQPGAVAVAEEVAAEGVEGVEGVEEGEEVEAKATGAWAQQSGE